MFHEITDEVSDLSELSPYVTEKNVAGPSNNDHIFFRGKQVSSSSMEDPDQR